jgi:hypothetical protein
MTRSLHVHQIKLTLVGMFPTIGRSQMINRADLLEIRSYRRTTSDIYLADIDSHRL